MRTSIPLAALALAAYANPTFAGDPATPPHKMLADVPAYITGLEHDGKYLFWGEEPFGPGRKGGVFRLLTPSGQVGALWTGKSVHNLDVGKDEVFFTAGLELDIRSIPKAGGEARTVLAASALTALTAIAGGALIDDLAVVGDMVIVGVSPAGKCADDAGAIVLVGTDGSDVKLLASAVTEAW